MAIILGQLYCGSQMAMEGGLQTAIGTSMIAYGGSSLAGYFNVGDAPLARLIRTGVTPSILAVLAVISLMT